MKNKLVAQRYANAVIMNVNEDLYASLLDDVTILNQIFASSPESIKIIDSFLLSIPKRIELTKDITAKLKNANIWKNLFEILIKKHRFSIILDILKEIEIFILHSRNQIKVVLKIAHSISNETLEKIKSKIVKILKKDIVLNIQIAPEIIGGFVAEAESIHIDGSIKNNLIKFINIKSNK